MKIIDKKIKELYNNDKAIFYSKMGWSYKNGARKIKQIETKIEDVEEFLSHLKLKLQIVEISENPNKVETDEK